MGQAEERAVMPDCKIQRVPEDPTTRKQVKETEKVAIEDKYLGGNRERIFYFSLSQNSGS